MWIKIVLTKTWEKMQEDLENMRLAIVELQGQHKNLHELYKGLYQKYLTEKNELSDVIKQRDMEIEKLKKNLRKAEHDKAVAFKKLRKYENPDILNTAV